MITRERELAEFQIRWSGKPKAQVVEELASYSLETKLIPDPYSFSINPDGRLISPETGSPIEFSIEKNSLLGNLEYQGFLSLQDWAVKNKSGVAIWISPPHIQRSELTKIVVSELVQDGKEKKIFNYAVRLDLTTDDCLNLAKNLPLTLPFDGEAADELRTSVLFLDLQKDDNWLTILHTFIGKQRLWRLIESGEAELAKEKAKLLAASIVEGKSTLDEYFGNYSSSCPAFTAFDAIFKNASFAELSFPCPRCERPIPSGRGITLCPHCGAKKEDFEKCD